MDYLRSRSKMVIAVLLGQFLSLVITGTGVTSELLARDHNVMIPTTQSFINYLLLMIVYLPIYIYQQKSQSLVHLKLNGRWWVYPIVALIDVEANFLVVMAYQYTTITSIMLIDCFAIPTVIVLSRYLLKTRYSWIHIIGVSLCLVGLVLLVVSDLLTGRTAGQEGLNVVKGDLLCLAGAFMYGIGNVSQEYLVKQNTSAEFLGLLGLGASVISSIQMYVLERDQLASIEWNGEIILLLAGFAGCLFCLYSLVPYFLRIAGATLLNLSLLTSDFYGLLIGIALFSFKVTWLYALAFIIIITGLVIYERQPPVSSHVLLNEEEERRGDLESNRQENSAGNDQSQEEATPSDLSMAPLISKKDST